MARIDWSVLSGPRVSRRTLLAFAAATGAAGYASRLQAAARHASHHAPRSAAPRPRGAEAWAAR